MNTMRKIKLLITLAFVVLCTGCSFTAMQTSVPIEDETMAGQEIEEEDLKASDTAILIRKDIANSRLTFQTVGNGAKYDLTYTGTTEFYDKYGQALAAAQLTPGEIVELVLSVHSKTLQTLSLCADAFVMQDVERHDFNERKGIMTIGRNNYKMDENLVIFSGDTTGELMDINEGDLLTVRGIGRHVFSVSIDKGHGYLRLQGDEYFRGGWIEVGQKIIKPLSENMLLLVPEGEYDIRVTYNGFGGNKEVVIERDKETLCDISDLKGDLLKTGKIAFTITPSDADAKLFIDGNEYSLLLPVEVEYGIHKMEIRADGYRKVQKYISVGQEMAAITIDLDEEEEKSTVSASKINSELKPESDNVISGNKASSSSSRKSSSSTSSSSRKSSSSGTSGGKETITVDDQGVKVESDTYPDDTTSTDGNQLYIDSPEGVEVYYDSAYKGIAPLHFAKSGGTHVITLRKDGYVPKSYTITLEDGDQDETYSFSDLVKEEE